jgi:hypothetical protein
MAADVVRQTYQPSSYRQIFLTGGSGTYGTIPTNILDDIETTVFGTTTTDTNFTIELNYTINQYGTLLDDTVLYVVYNDNTEGAYGPATWYNYCVNSSTYNNSIKWIHFSTESWTLASGEHYTKKQYNLSALRDCIPTNQSTFTIRSTMKSAGSPGVHYGWGMMAVNYSIDNSTIPVNITRTSQVPSDINITNVIGTPLKISYNINGSDLISSSIQLWYKSNNTNSNIMYYLNGTGFSGFFNDNLSLTPRVNTGSNYTWTLLDNEILPGTYNFGPVAFDRLVHANVPLANSNQYVKTEYYNISSSAQYGIFEIMANSSLGASPVSAYYCNSSYTTGSITGNTNCALIGTMAATTGYEHCHANLSCHNDFPFTVNTTTKRIGNVGVTNISYFIFGGNNNWNVYNVPNLTRIGMTQTTTNTGGGWTSRTYTVDQHVHQLDVTADYSFYYYACANNTLGTGICDTVYQDLFEVGGLEPTSTTVYSPLNTTYNRKIDINYTTAESPNGYVIVRYNISLLNSTYGFLSTIIANNSNNLNYSWNNIGTSDGYYIVRVEAYDSIGQHAYFYSEEFIINNNAPVVTYDASIMNNTNITNTYHNVLFKFVDNFSSIANCTLYLNNTINVTNITVANNTITGLNITGITYGTYGMYINCTSNNSNIGLSSTYDFIRPFPTLTILSPQNNNISKNFLSAIIEYNDSSTGIQCHLDVNGTEVSTFNRNDIITYGVENSDAVSGYNGLFLPNILCDPVFNPSYADDGNWGTYSTIIYPCANLTWEGNFSEPATLLNSANLKYYYSWTVYQPTAVNAYCYNQSNGKRILVFSDSSNAAIKSLNLPTACYGAGHTWISFDYTGASENNPFDANMTYTSGTNNIYTINYTPPTTGNYSWNATCNNSEGIFTTSTLRNFVYDLIAPTIGALSTNVTGTTPNVGDHISLMSNITDNYLLQNCSLYTNQTGTYSVETTFNPAGVYTPYDINYSYIAPSETSIGWYIACTDTAGNTEISSPNVFTIKDFASPTITLGSRNDFLTDNSTVISAKLYNLSLSVKYQDNGLISSYTAINCNVSGNIYSFAQGDYNATIGWVNSTINLYSLPIQTCIVTLSASDSLNIVANTYKFYIGGYANISNINLYDNSYLDLYRINYTTTSEGGSNGHDIIATGKTYRIENLTGGNYNFVFYSTTTVPIYNTVNIGAVKTSLYYNTSEAVFIANAYNTFNYAPLLSNFYLNRTTVNIAYIQNNTAKAIYYMNASLMRLIVTSTTFTTTDNFTLSVQQNLSKDYLLGAPLTVFLKDEQTNGVFNLAGTNSTKLLVKCINSTEYYNITTTTYTLPISCNFTSLQFDVNYGTFSYYRTFITINQSSTVYLADGLTSAVVNNNFYIQDLFNKYINKKVIVKELIGANLVEITGGELDMEGKFKTYLIENNNYQIWIYSDNQPPFMQGTYIADTVVNKYITLGSFSPEMSAGSPSFNNNVYYYIYLNNDTANNTWINILYNDTSSLTTSIVWTIYNESDGTLYDTITIVNASYFFASYNITPLINGSLSSNLLFAYAGKNYNDKRTFGLREFSQEIFTFVTKTWMNWALFILITILAIMSTVKTGNIMNLFICGVAAFFVFAMKWFELGIGVLIFVVIITIIGFLKSREKEGYYT